MLMHSLLPCLCALSLLKSGSRSILLSLKFPAAVCFLTSLWPKVKCQEKKIKKIKKTPTLCNYCFSAVCDTELCPIGDVTATNHPIAQVICVKLNWAEESKISTKQWTKERSNNAHWILHIPISTFAHSRLDFLHLPFYFQQNKLTY